MKLFAKCGVITFLFAAALGRSIEPENLSNSTEDQIEIECDCDWRYFKHYEIKDCVLEKVDSCGCPKKFSCSQNQTSQSSKVCVYRNKEYPIGSKIITENACQRCRCHGGTPPFLSCVQVECPLVEFAAGKDCHLVYEENRCCPKAHKCLMAENEDEITSNKTCEYNGKIYPYGSKIYPVDDPCQICLCNENWSGAYNSSCYVQDCVLEQRKSKLDAGCIPVYHERQCCPIEFYCSSSLELTYSSLSSNGSETNKTSISDQCTFGNLNYDIGDQLFMDNPCVMCQCLVPPDFTCIHQTCPPSPNDENCYPVHKREECCPSYECMHGDANPGFDSVCPTPLCAHAGCRIETPPGHECATCVCEERMSELEHNDVQQQVQQINQAEEPYQQISEGQRETGSEDYSEEELQLMPIQIQDSEGQFSVMERIALPSSDDVEQYPEEIFRELEDDSRENNSSSEAEVLTDLEEALNNPNTEILSEPELDDSVTEYNSSEIENIQKRSTGGPAFVAQQEKIFGGIPENNEDIERERETFESNGEFDDELERFRNKIFDRNGTIINEIFSVNHEVEVPAGCPTPLCEGSWCKIGIPPGHRCPTCICNKSHVGNEP